ncbi:MAG: sigma-70 family RNA polymerase sigma factor [Phycisphaerae bacterium]|jgi:RNA polymerase sigma factor (sigma-70 family)|nr:sigma-70 family RNA polymerase sigma factor [Phycisphaerae bacterium]MBT5364929.1 sigma-70 family RNA polymerase sigma factor [Phycisphaerae bacterium]MBT6282005.1 sigma-70 family RNA polymerase sigma factor [Phycisphaerae bacterium]
MNALTTTFVRRLRERDESAWFELWQDFGPAIRFQLQKWGRGRVGIETVQDLTQDTLAELSKCIDRYDPNRGARFSTWLLSIAKHILGDEMDRRNAKKRGSGVKPLSLDVRIDSKSAVLQVDEIFEQRIFGAKICSAIRRTETEVDFLHFQVWRMRVLDNKTGKEISTQLGISEPTVSRHVAKIREHIKETIMQVVMQYSFTPEEEREPSVAGMGGNDSEFDAAVSEAYHHHQLFLEKESARNQV